MLVPFFLFAFVWGVFDSRASCSISLAQFIFAMNETDNKAVGKKKKDNFLSSEMGLRRNLWQQVHDDVVDESRQ